MQVTNGESLLEKYDLKADDAILAEEKHMPMYDPPFTFFIAVNILLCSYDELIKDFSITYVAGGASQNAARGAAV